MPFTTPQQFVLLAVILVAGWLIGYASAPGTRKYKRQLQDESARAQTKGLSGVGERMKRWFKANF